LMNKCGHIALYADGRLNYNLLWGIGEPYSILTGCK
jgi:hypothetical protein